MLRDLRRSIQHWRTDAYLLSFPKCGRTWLRVMLAKVIECHYGITIADSTRLHACANRMRGIPRVRVTHDWKDPQTMQVSRDKSRFADKRIVHMIRDPRDVAVSQYFHRTQRRKNYDGTLEEFVREGRGSLADIVAYYNVWSEWRDRVGGYMQLRYEDLRVDTDAELVRVVEFLGISDVSDQTIANAVEFCRFERMQRMEREHQFESSRLQPKDPSNPQSFKTRSGKIGGYRDHFSDDLATWADDYIRAHLHADYAGYWPEVGDE